MVMSKKEIWQSLIELASNIDTVGARQIGKKIAFTNDTDLVDDLGLLGDDASQFMEAFASRFNLEIGDYETRNYFDSEGLWLLPKFKKNKAKRHITLGMLAMAAAAGVWEAEKLHQAYQRKQYE